MFVFAWSLLSSYAEHLRKSRLHSALTSYLNDPSSSHQMLVCRQAAHRLTRLPAAGFSSWGADTANGSLARIASAPFLNREDNEYESVIYRGEGTEVVTVPYESTALSDWRLLPSTSHFSPANASVFFIAACPRANDYEQLVASTSEESEDQSDTQPGLVMLDSICFRVGWNRTQPTEVLYACEADTFTDVVFAWTNGTLRTSLRRKRPVTKLRTVWLIGRLKTDEAVNGDSVVSCPSSPPASYSSLEGHSSLSTSRVHSPTHSEASTILPYTDPKPLLEQLFLGDQMQSSSFTSLLGCALKKGLDTSDTSLHLLSRHLDCTLPRRAMGRRAYLFSSSHAALPSLPFTDRYKALTSVSTTTLPFTSDRVSLHSIPRVSRSSLRHRASSPRVIDLPRHPTMIPIPRLDSSLKKKPLTAMGANHSSNAHPSGTLQHNRKSSLQQKIVSETVSPEKELEATTVIEQVCEATVSTQDCSHLSQSSSTPPCTVSPSITVTSDLGEVAEEEEGTVIGEEAEDGMPFELSVRSSSARRPKVKGISVRRQETAPGASSEPCTVRRSPRTLGTSANPMLEALRGRPIMGSADKEQVPVNPLLQKLTTIELLQRRRHSHAMYPIDASLFQEGAGGRRRSLSPIALTATMAGGRYGIADSGVSSCGSGLLDSFRRGQSRRMHSATRSEKPAMKPPAILVYTAGDTSLYTRIHKSLSRVLMPNMYTVFNISPDWIRRSHWIDTTTACLIIADTRDLDDAAWMQLHEYFNKSGKIIFVCQNKLLSSISSCESVKKQASLLRLAFCDKGGSGTMNKDLESFLKKTLKHLAKHDEVNEKYQSKDIVGGLKYTVVLAKKKTTPLLLYMESGGAHCASAVFSDANTEQLLSPDSSIVRESLERVGVKVEMNVQLPALSIGYFIADGEFLTSCQTLRYGVPIGGIPSLFMRRRDFIADHPLPSPSTELLPVQVLDRNDASLSCSFDSNRYFAKLDTIVLGRKVLYIPVTTTTMDVSKSLSDALPGCNGIVVIARQQIKGQGRGGNEFIAPEGVAMFTFNYSLPSSSALAKCPSFVQHVVAVATVSAVHELSTMQDFPLRIKWPNDFYCNRSHKVGGLLVTARCQDDAVEFTAGVGLNVSNSRPTTCLNDMLPDNAPESANFSVEEVIAATLNQFERLVNLYENKGQEAFLEQYYKYWLHTREEVTLGDAGGERVVIRGLDKYGFLQVRSRKNPSQLYSVTDDGNTFDMMKGLIRLKIK